MDHNDIRHKLSEYLDNEVTPEERSAIEAHLLSCRECADAVAELRRTIEHMQSIEDVEAPSWMTGRIMAAVREEAEKKTVFQRLFFPLAVKVPLQAVAVLFLAVTAFYIYQGMNPAQKYAEAPPTAGPITKEIAPPAEEAAKQRPPVVSERREKKVAQAPGYRSLDMKDEYEKPALPVPAKDKAAEERALSRKEASPAPSSMMASPAAPSVTAEQAAGVARPPKAKQEATGQGGALTRKAFDELSASDREAEERLAVTEYFASQDLQESMKIKGLQFITRRVPDDLAGLEWLREMKVYRSVPCAKRYIVDVDLPGSSFKYLYCYERSRVRRLGVFEPVTGVWMERK